MTPTRVRQAADELAETLRADAADRDRANQPPVREVELLRKSGLLALPPDDVVTAAEVTRIVAAADASIGHLLGYHHLQLWRSELFDNTELTTRMRRDTVERHLFWAGASNPLDADLELTQTEAGFSLSGHKSFATGASVADRLVASGTRTDTGAKLTFVLDGTAPGVSYPDGWDNMGQRLSASGGVTFDRVTIDTGDVLGEQPAGDQLRLSLAALGFQVALSQLYVGIAQGALAESAAYTRQRTRAWILSGVASASDDPYVLASYGELVATTEAARLLAVEAARALQAAADQGDALTAEQRGAAAVTISAAKVVTTTVANETTSRIFELIGARGTAARFGFDRFWRNARTLTLHDPVAYKAREVGAHFLTGTMPTISGYS